MNFLNSNLFQYLRKTVLLLFLLFSISIIHARSPFFPPADRDVRGKVVDEKGAPLASVSVVVKGTTIGTTTDDQGVFNLHVPSGKTVIVVSIVGFQSQEVKLGSDNNISVSMVTSVNQMNDVVVVGYGTAKKATLTGAISSVKGDEVLKSPSINVSNNLVGRLTGIAAVQGSSEPGYDGSALQIRGFNTLNDNSVLVIVDGVPGRSLDRIDPNSIESVTILKDASAAIYGSRAANGVILITTKRGKVGKPQLGLNINAGYSQPTVLPKMADAATFAQMNNEIIIYARLQPSEWLAAYNAFKATGQYTSSDPGIGTINASSQPIDGSPDGIKKYIDGSDPWGHPNTDWFKAVLKPRSNQDALNLTISGGTENTRYFVSLGTNNQDGNYFHSATGYNQYNFRTNIDSRISKDINIAFDVVGREESRRYPTRSAGSIFREVMRGKPTQPAYWPDGTPGPDIEYGDNPAVISTDATGYYHDKNYVLNSNLKLNINIPWIKGLSLTGNAAIDKNFDFVKNWNTPWYLYTWDYSSYHDVNGQQVPVLTPGKRGYDAPSLNETYTTNYLSTVNGLLNYDNTFGGVHSVKFLAGIEEEIGNSDYFTASKFHYVSPALDQLFAGAALDQSNNGSGSVSARLSYFGRVNYAYKSKYMAEFVWRYDGSYIFAPPPHRFGFFPGVSAGWVASEEDFWKKNLSFINYFKLRGSWGQTGNDRIGLWQYLGSYSIGNFLGLGYYPFVTNGSLENTTVYETHVPNPEVTWEVANQADIGFNAAMLKNKLVVEGDYFSYKRTQMLIPPTGSIPSLTGYQPPYVNGGEVDNKGFELNISYSDAVGKFHYKVSVNGSYAKNKVKDYPEADGLPDYQKIVGHSLFTGNYYVAEGVFVDQKQVDNTPHYSGAQPGDIIFKDVNGDGIIDGNDQTRIEKTNFPTFTFGSGIDLQYGQFDLSVLVQGATGAVNYNISESGLIGNFPQSFADGRWTPADPSSVHPRTFDRGTPYWASLNNTYFLHKTDYVRVKNIQFGYSLTPDLCKKIGLNTARLYFSGYNLFTYAPDYKDFDPEQAAGNGESYPLNKVVNFGISVTF